MVAPPLAYAAAGEHTSPQWVAAFAAGCSGQSQIGGPLRDGDVAMFGSPQLEPLLFEAQRQGRGWFYGDHAFFGRKQFYRCARNAMQFDGAEGDDDPARFRRFKIPVQDWRHRGSHVLLCPNSASFLTRHGASNWISDVRRVLAAHTDRPIRLRWKKDAELRPLAADLRDCWAVVTFTSNAAVEAILAGVPAFCTAACAGLTMGSANLQEIETPLMPEGRLAWASRLANNQWTLAEMQAGMLWSALRGNR